MRVSFLIIQLDLHGERNLAPLSMLRLQLSQSSIYRRSGEAGSSRVATGAASGLSPLLPLLLFGLFVFFPEKDLNFEGAERRVSASYAREKKTVSR